MKNQGISLISLIITIIVIIILAAIVIFSGLNTPDSAQFAGFTQQVDNVYSAVMNKYGDLKAKHAISGDYRTDEQIYLEIAIADNKGQFVVMNGTAEASADAAEVAGSATTHTNRIINIDPEKSNSKTNEYSLGMTLPKVRQYNDAWYITRDGRVFNANGFTYDNKTYFSGSIYTAHEIASKSGNNIDRATTIWSDISGDSNIVRPGIN